MMEGFCISCGNDVPVDGSRSCLRDGQITIAPTYGKRTQQWVDGAWAPPIPRPEGYVWTPPGATERKVAQPPSTYRREAPKPQKMRASAPRQSRAAAQPVMVTVVCEVCRVKVTRRRWGGHQQRYCSQKCRNQSRGARGGRHDQPRKLMSTLGLRCADCGRDDVPYRANGMCPVCAQRARRRAKREAAA